MTPPAWLQAEWLQDTALLPTDIQSRIVATLFILAVLWALHALVIRIVDWRMERLGRRYRWRKIVHYVTILLGVILVGREWIQGLAALTTFLGLAAAGIAIAMRDALVGIAGFFYILLRRPFDMGDRIQIGDVKGDVIDIHMFGFSLVEIGNWVDADQSTGRVVHVPTNRVMVEPVVNYTREFPYIWHELAVTLTFDSDWERAKTILTDVLQRNAVAITEQARHEIKQAAKRHFIVFSKLTPIVYTSVAENGVRLTMRFLCEPRRRRSTSQMIWEDALRSFRDAGGIHFAYPALRVYDGTESRAAATAPREAE